MRITVLCGGFGGARLALALQEAGLESSATFVTNVADDIEIGDLLVCPDTDAVLYALAGRFDEERGWGLRGDRFPGARPGEPPWFNLGERDRAHHEQRRDLLAVGAGLGAATGALARRYGIAATVVPVTDGPLRTRVRVGGDRLTFQEWLIRAHAPAPDQVDLEGAGLDDPAPGVLDAVGGADVVILASSSPIASLHPILSVAGVAATLRSRTGPTVALAPMALGLGLATERDRRRAAARSALMACRGIDHDPAGYARWVGGLVSHHLLDPADRDWAPAVAAAAGATVGFAPIVGAERAERAATVAAALSSETARAG